LPRACAAGGRGCFAAAPDTVCRVTRIAIVSEVALDELVALYASVGWVAYTAAPETLGAAIAGSTCVVTARDDNDRLVGLARAISDGATVCYLQDILVAPDRHRTGIGRALVRELLVRFAGVRQKVLLTDDEPGQRAFYESLGFTEIRDLGTLRAFVRFDRVS
jgi:GNAT superfamily N-acetyltransferase